MLLRRFSLSKAVHFLELAGEAVPQSSVLASASGQRDDLINTMIVRAGWLPTHCMKQFFVAAEASVAMHTFATAEKKKI